MKRFCGAEGLAPLDQVYSREVAGKIESFVKVQPKISPVFSDKNNLRIEFAEQFDWSILPAKMNAKEIFTDVTNGMTQRRDCAVNMVSI